MHPSHPKAAFWGCVLSLMGFIGYGALDGIDYMAWVAGKTPTARFDDPNLVSCAGVVPVMALAQRCGLVPLLTE